MNNHTTSITTNKKHHYRELLAIGIPIIIGQLGTAIPSLVLKKKGEKFGS